MNVRSASAVALENGCSRLEVEPSCGALITRLVLDGVDIFYMDPATLDHALRDPSRSVRGGMPILFPVCGPLPEGRCLLEGHTLSLRQHGFARNLPWTVSALDAHSIELTLAASEMTRAGYPFEFEVRLRYVLEQRALRAEVVVRSLGVGPVPFDFGFHPYFRLVDRDSARLDLAATSSAANPDGLFAPLRAPIALDGALLDHAYMRSAEPPACEGSDLGFASVEASRVASLWPVVLRDELSGTCVRVSAGDAFTKAVVWTQPCKAFVCVEPWTGRAHQMAAGQAQRACPDTPWQDGMSIELLEPAASLSTSR